MLWNEKNRTSVFHGITCEERKENNIKIHAKPFLRSNKLLTDNNHLDVGAQKKIVMGPAGCSDMFLTKEGILSEDKTLLIRPDIKGIQLQICKLNEVLPSIGYD